MSGKKGRKIGKNRTRSVSMANYRATGRMFTNKKRKVQKAQAFVRACAEARSIHPERNDICRIIREELL